MRIQPFHVIVVRACARTEIAPSPLCKISRAVGAEFVGEIEHNGLRTLFYLTGLLPLPPILAGFCSYNVCPGAPFDK